MFKARLMLLSMLAVVSAFGVMASSASAKISFEWFVSGKLLAAGQSRTFTSTADGRTFDLAGEIPGVSAVLLQSNKLKVAKARIFGGKPGTNEEIIEFENVTVASPAGCVVETDTTKPTVGLVVTNELKSEIVEGQNGETLILYTPKTGKVFTGLVLLNKSGTETCLGGLLNGALGNVEGSILSLPLPQRTEALSNHLDFEAATKEFLLSSGGAIEKSGLTFAGATSTLTGLALVLLTTDEKFGAF
jgi:hypothetical protein